MKYKVVVADKEPIMQKAIRTLVDWERLECELVDVYSDGKAIMNVLEENAPDILIMDIELPEYDGIQIAKYIWEKKIFTKVIFLTESTAFHHAQAAVRYNVADYIVKTGAFKELETALENAKKELRELHLQYSEENLELFKENFFKSVFDGTLYSQEELNRKAGMIGLEQNANRLVLKIYYRLKDDKRRAYAYKSLHNFLKMVFEEQLIYSSATEKDVLVVVLSIDEEAYFESVKDKCLQISETMNNFMNMRVYVGVSRKVDTIAELRVAYDEAEFALQEGFFYDNGHINYYTGPHKENKEFAEYIEQSVKNVEYSIKKGRHRDALEQFAQIIDYLKQNGSSTNRVFQIGIDVKNWCKRLLVDFDATIYDIVPYKRGISKMIYQCRHISEYMVIMNTIISKTSKYLNQMVSKKNILLYEVDKYIEENYENDVTVSDISKKVGVSLSYLSRIYKVTTGKTIIQHISEKKIDKAKEYLESTDMKIYEIAEKLGFENTTYFSYFFKKHTNVSPKDYKDSLKKQ